jgi:hypothetical protein
MMVSDDHVAALRAHLGFRPEEFEPLHERLIQTGGLAGYGALVHGAFVSAVRRRFAPAWAVSAVVRFVTTARIHLCEADIDIDPQVSEVLIRRALGERVPVELDAEAVGRAQIFLLSELIADEGLDEAGLEEFLVDARALADQLAD